MAQSLVGSLTVKPVFNYSNGLDLTTVTDALNKTYTENLTNGTGANKAQIQWHDTRSLLTTTDETLDLTALAGGPFGTASFSKIKQIIIKVNTTTSGYRLEMGAAAANQWAGAAALLKDTSDLIRLCAGGLYVFTAPVDGFTVDATHKDLKITNPSGGTVSYDIIIIGEGTQA